MDLKSFSGFPWVFLLVLMLKSVTEPGASSAISSAKPDQAAGEPSYPPSK